VKEKKNKLLKICIVCSAGGHFSEALRATEKIEHKKYFVTYYNDTIKEFARNNKVFFVTHPRHCALIPRLMLFARNCIESALILLKERPDLIISTGADVAVATCIIGKLFRSKLIYIEAGGYVTSKSLSGRIIYPFADLFLVQWEAAKKNFPNAIYGGPLF
jgi:UDP-N-acetylglucosamine:LPS N-acetylglucosamine transferase